MSLEKCPECSKEPTEDELLAQFEEILDGYVGKPGGLIPALQTAQKLFGYLPKRVLQLISMKLDIPYSEVTGVVSFYSFFTTVPKGKYMVRVCLGTACYVRGGKDVLAALEKELEIGVGGTTSDGLFSLDVGCCFGACGLAPVIMVNDETHQRVKPEKVKEIIDFYRDIEMTIIKEKAG